VADCGDAFFNANRCLECLNSLTSPSEFSIMNHKSPNETARSDGEPEPVGRRLFLQSLGKWSGAAIAAVLGSTWLACPPEVGAGGWINRWGGGGGGWINRRGGGGGGWINRGGGGWVNRWGGGGGGWINRGGGGGGWINRW
jgi:hypothetical protein